MGIKEIIKKSFLEGYATSNITLTTVLICTICTAAIAIYIYYIYKQINKKSFYNKEFNLSLVVLALITSAIILTIQSNIVVSLGMVGALSIVRFRTAIKNPMDLVFLFWSISVGIICGAGFALIAIVVSIVITLVIIMFNMPSNNDKTLLLVINAVDFSCEDAIMKIVNDNCLFSKVRARNVSKDNFNIAIEIKTREESVLIGSLLNINGIINASLVEHDGNITA